MSKIQSTEVAYYRYRWRFLPAAWFAVSTLFFALLTRAVVYRQGWLQGIAFFLFAYGFVLVMTMILIMSLADIYVDDYEIRRSALGLTWQRAKWVDVEELRITPSKNVENGQNVRSFTIRSTWGKGCFFSWIIAFQERVDGMGAVLKKIKRCTEIYNLRVVDRTSTF